MHLPSSLALLAARVLRLRAYGTQVTGVLARFLATLVARILRLYSRGTLVNRTLPTVPTDPSPMDALS